MTRQIITELKDTGPAMQALHTDKQRRFVMNYCRNAGKNATRCAVDAGYADSQGTEVWACRMLRDPKILAAIREETEKLMHAGIIGAAHTVLDISKDRLHKDALGAAKLLLGQVGLGATQTIKVEHVKDRADQIKEIVELAKMLGRDPTEFLGANVDTSKIVDVDFEVVPALVDNSMAVHDDSIDFSALPDEA